MTPSLAAQRATHRSASDRERRRPPRRGIDRCPNCGAWRYLAQCWTPLPACRHEEPHR